MGQEFINDRFAQEPPATSNIPAATAWQFSAPATALLPFLPSLAHSS